MGITKLDTGVTVVATGVDEPWDLRYSELHNGDSGLTFRIERVLEATQSEFQRIDVLESKQFGKMLALYGSLMVADNDHNAYNEMISHVPLFTHPNPKRILIIGGGDCGALTETLKHPGVELCTMCEIDKQVVETSKRHFPHLTAGLNDPRAEVLYRDGKEYIKESGEKFDIALLDLSDPIGPAADLFQKPFHRDMFERLSDDGIMVAQSESPFYNGDAIKAMWHNLRDIFPIVKLYTCFMPIYPSSYWSFIFCSKKYDPVKDLDQSRWDHSPLATRYYNPETHRASFGLPQWVKKMLDQ